jgi:hypothetical protein
MTGVGATVTTSQGQFSTQITLDAQALASAISTGSLTTTIILDASALTEALSDASLFTQIQLTSQASSQTSATGSLADMVRYQLDTRFSIRYPAAEVVYVEGRTTSVRYASPVPALDYASALAVKYRNQLEVL